MGADVFANGRGLSGKANANMTLGAMPDVCLSPPSPPAGPIPIPYPNFSKAKDTSSGSKKVKMKGKEIGLKNKSDYKSSKGNEAATRSFGMGIVSHNLSGAMKHVAWSFDVKIENQNAIRHLDLTMHNHGNTPQPLTGINQESITTSGKDPTCDELHAQALADKRQQKSRGCAARGLVKKDDKRWIMRTRPLKSSTRNAGEGIGAFWSDKEEEVKYYDSYMCKSRKEGEFKEFEYGQNCQAGICDAEAKMIEDLAYKFGPTMKDVSLKMSVTKRPCASCQRVMCHAQACGLDIKICIKDEETKTRRPQKPKCDPGEGSGKKEPGPMDEQLPAKSYWTD